MPLEDMPCSTATELLERLAQRTVSPLTKRRRWIYRGQGDARWRLVPKAFRLDPPTRFPAWFAGFHTVAEHAAAQKPVIDLVRKKTPGVPESLGIELSQVSLELGVLQRFFEVADQAGLPLPEDSQVLRQRLNPYETAPPSDLRWLADWPELKLRSVLALAQHYGLPTRLLDWSHDSRVAAFFAAKKALERKTDGLAVWALDWEALKLRGLFELISQSPNLKRPLPGCRVRVVTAPAATNSNLRAQRGLFTLLEPRPAPPSGEETIHAFVERLQELRQPLDALADRDEVWDADASELSITIRKLSLPTSEAVELLKLLALDDVTAARVWPTYDGVGESICDAARGWA